MKFSMCKRVTEVMQDAFDVMDDDATDRVPEAEDWLAEEALLETARKSGDLAPTAPGQGGFCVVVR